MNRIWFILVASLLLLSCNKQTPEKEVLPRTQKERVRWFEEARLGIDSLVTVYSGIRSFLW